MFVPAKKTFVEIIDMNLPYFFRKYKGQPHRDRGIYSFKGSLYKLKGNWILYVPL